MNKAYGAANWKSNETWMKLNLSEKRRAKNTFEINHLDVKSFSFIRSIFINIKSNLWYGTPLIMWESHRMRWTNHGRDNLDVNRVMRWPKKCWGRKPNPFSLPSSLENSTRKICIRGHAIWSVSPSQWCILRAPRNEAHWQLNKLICGRRKRSASSDDIKARSVSTPKAVELFLIFTLMTVSRKVNK